MLKGTQQVSHQDLQEFIARMDQKWQIKKQYGQIRGLQPPQHELNFWV